MQAQGLLARWFRFQPGRLMPSILTIWRCGWSRLKSKSEASSAIISNSSSLTAATRGCSAWLSDIFLPFFRFQRITTVASEFSVGVIIGGIVGSSFRSAVSGTRRAPDSLGDTSRRLQERQNALTRATERYGQLGSSRMQRLNSDLLRVSRTMEQIERQQRRLSAVSATSDALLTAWRAMAREQKPMPSAEHWGHRSWPQSNNMPRLNRS